MSTLGDRRSQSNTHLTLLATSLLIWKVEVGSVLSYKLHS